MLMSLAQELPNDIGMKYQSTYVLDENNQPVYFRDYVGGDEALVVTENREEISKPLSELFAPVFPWGFCNNLSGTNFIHLQRTAARTVKKGICDNTVHSNTSLNHNVIRAALSPSFSTWRRLKDGTSKGALSSMFAVNGSHLLDLAGRRIANIINEHIVIKASIDNNYNQWLQGELARIVGEGVVVDRDDERVVSREEEEHLDVSRFFTDRIFTTTGSDWVSFSNPEEDESVPTDDEDINTLRRMRNLLAEVMTEDEEIDDDEEVI